MRMYYWDGANFGDAASPLLVSRLLGRSVSLGTELNADFYAVGSILCKGQYLGGPLSAARATEKWRTVRRLIRTCGLPPLHIWGSGFSASPEVLGRFVRYRRLRLHAVRGTRTVGILRRLGYPVDGEAVALGDPGLLYDRLLEGPGAAGGAVYDVGVVPHFWDIEIGEALGRALTAAGLRVAVIDVRKEPVQVIGEIASCRSVLSSSLHGCVVADSLHIPNRHVVFSTWLQPWEAFILKFDDYYSAFGLDGDEPLRLDEVIARSTELPEFLARTTRVAWDAVEARKAALEKAFPKAELLKL